MMHVWGLTGFIKQISKYLNCSIIWHITSIMCSIVLIAPSHCKHQQLYLKVKWHIYVTCTTRAWNILFILKKCASQHTLTFIRVTGFPDWWPLLSGISSSWWVLLINANACGFSQAMLKLWHIDFYFLILLDQIQYLNVLPFPINHLNDVKNIEQHQKSDDFVCLP